MKMAKWILPLLLLVGCGDDDPPCGGYGCHTSYLDEETGVSARYDRESSVSQSDLVAIYKATMSCTGIYAEGPAIVFVNEASDAHARYFRSDRFIVIYNTAKSNPWGGEPGVIRHEMIHHLLGFTGATDADNGGHGSPFFNICI